jgi:lipopolysaccharide export system protein LptC
MSVAAERQHSARRLWALPGGSHDRLMRLLKRALPVMVGVLAAFLATAPFTGGNEVSFLLDKNKVEVARERLRVTEALYRGEDGKGQPFSLRAGSALQKSSREPVVQLYDMEARLLMAEGPAVLDASRGQYDMDREQVAVMGPVLFRSANGYRLTTRDVDIDLKTRRLASRGQVDGRMPVGTFSGQQLRADLQARTVTLVGNARLRIEQGGLRKRP